MLTGTVAANTRPENTVGWMSTPSVAVVEMRRRHSCFPVLRSSASTPSEPASANTRLPATATPNGPMFEPVAALCQRVLPVARSIATTTPDPPWKYTVSPITNGAVDSDPIPGGCAV